MRRKFEKRRLANREAVMKRQKQKAKGEFDSHFPRVAWRKVEEEEEDEEEGDDDSKTINRSIFQLNRCRFFIVCLQWVSILVL